MNIGFQRCVAALIACAVALPPALAQTPPPPPQGQAGAPQSGGAPAYKQEELDQMLAPIALYPDALVVQILMASTYPLDVVAAARWRKENAALKGDALQDALQKQSWDESVKSLTEFPDVLERMNKDLAWTQKVGDAFLGQQQQVMDTIQALRQRAQAAGNLSSNQQQTVETQTQEGKQVIVIQPANPEIIYVPIYQPTVVYGAWPYPAYPPYYPPYWAPVGGAFVSGFFWGVGIAAGAALWGGANWGRGDVNVNVNRYNNFNRTNVGNGNWNHRPEHRGNVPYRDNGSRQKYGAQNRQAAQGRDQFRGRSEGAALNDRAGRQDAANRGVGQGGGGNRAGAGQGAAGANRGAAPSQNFGGGNANRGSAPSQNFGGSNSNRGGAFNSGSGAQTRESSNRGNSSMSNRSAGGGAGASRGGGGASRGGGGGGARGGGGGGRGGGGRR